MRRYSRYNRKDFFTNGIMQKKPTKLSFLQEISLFLIFLLGCSAVSWYAFVERSEERQHLQIDFNNSVDDIEMRITREQELLHSLFISTQSFISASRFVDSHEWSVFVKTMKLQQRYPYFLSFSYVSRIHSYELDDFLTKSVPVHFPELH